MKIENTAVLLTSEGGAKLSQQPTVHFEKGNVGGPHISIFPGRKKQIIDGLGSSFTESSAFVLAHLEPDQRQEVMLNIFGEQGANFSLTRSPIGSCDFCVEGCYSYADSGDLSDFDISVDKDGFNPALYPGIKDPLFDLLPMIKDAQRIKENQSDSAFKLMASAWTAPPWMKDIERWYINASPEHDFSGTGGSLKPEHEASYAAYLLKYLHAYQDEGVPVWSITPVNEPGGNSGQWESMNFSAESQRDFIKNHLGPALQSDEELNTGLLAFDHNRNDLEYWSNIIFGDLEAAEYVDGLAIHWYESTIAVSEDVLNRIHEKYPGASLIHTEGCIDDLGKDAPDGVLDPINFKESGWFDNDDFWWNCHATDWAYTATWHGVNMEDHPMYTPVHRYARNIIVSLNNWLNGWVDWNIVLDRDGGPNHVGNFCGAPIMIDTESGYVYYTPIFHILSQLSQTIRPGDRAVQTSLSLPDASPDQIHVCATISPSNLLSIQLLNTAKQPYSCALVISDAYAEIEIESNSLKTYRLQLS